MDKWICFPDGGENPLLLRASNIMAVQKARDGDGNLSDNHTMLTTPNGTVIVSLPFGVVYEGLTTPWTDQPVKTLDNGKRVN